MNDNIRIQVIETSRNIANALYAGNDVSKRMGRILNITISVLERSDARFDRMREELQSVYEDMSRVHNKVYQDLGGRMGSGGFVGVDIDEAEGKTGLEFNRLLDGIDPEGFNNLQLSISGLRHLMGKLTLSDGAPFRTQEVIFLERLEFSHWITLMSLYESKHRDRVLKILAKYDAKAS